MDMKQKWIVVVASGVAITFCALAAVSASNWISSTPLFVYRMEQASSEMNFLPTPMNDFTYIAENGHNLNYEVFECCQYNGVIPLKPTELTCDFTCLPTSCQPTCDSTCNTCPVTGCGPTCPYETCRTCATCDQYTCDGYDTCPYGSTCFPTCPFTCIDC